MVAQICAAVIFVAMFVLIISEKFERQWITLVAGLATIVVVFGLCMRSPEALFKTLNLSHFGQLDFWYTHAEGGESTSGINWATIVFIAGMMVMVEGMAHSGFFRWLCMALAKKVNYQIMPLFVVFMIMSAVLSMFIDSITVILFLAAVTIELAQMLKFDPIPMILSEIFCANLGGSATMSGDPPNIIIGTSLGYSFMDFLTNTGVIALVSLIVIIFYFILVFRKELVVEGDQDYSHMPEPSEAITDKRGFTISCIIFACAVVLLVTHAQTGLTVATIGVFIALVTLICFAKHAGELLSKVDYKTLLFFIGLFVVVGGLEQTGVLELIASFIETVSGGNAYVMVAIIIWVSAIASAFVDNIPFAATMIPVIESLAATTGVPLTTLAWSLSMGTDIGGSATPIGASANVVGTSVAAKEGYPVGWGRYCLKLAPATIIVVAISTVMIFVLHM